MNLIPVFCSTGGNLSHSFFLKLKPTGGTICGKCLLKPGPSEDDDDDDEDNKSE